MPSPSETSSRCTATEPSTHTQNQAVCLQLHLVNLLHLRGLVSSAVDLLQRRQVVIVTQTLIVIVDAQAKLDHAVDAPSELRGLIEVEARGQQGRVEQQPNQVLDGLVRLVRRSLLLQLRHDGMLRVHLHGLLRHHVCSHAVVAQSLCLHDAFHVRRPSVLGSREHAWRVCQTRTYQDLLHLVSQDFLHELSEWLELGFQLLDLLLLILIIDVQTLLGRGLQLLAIELLQLLHCIFINRVHHVQDLQPLLAEGLQEGRRRHGHNALTRDVVDVILTLLHTVNILLETDLLVTRLGAVIAHQLGHLSTIRGVLMDTELQTLAELFIELLVIILLLSDFREHLEALLHQVLLDHAQNFVLLQGLATDVQWQVLRVHHALDEIEPPGHQFVAIVHDEHATHVQLDVVVLLLALEEVERSPAWHKQQSSELQLSLHAEMFHRQVVLPIIGQALVERRVLLIRHVFRLAHPQGLVLVQLLPLVGYLLHLLRLLLFGLLLFLLIDLFDLGLVAILLFILLLLLLVLRVGHLLLLGLLNVQLNWETDELGVLLHQILHAAPLQKLRLVFLQIANDLRATLHLTVHHLCILLNCERATRARFPNILLIVVVLAYHPDFVGHKVRRVEAHAELTNHADVATRSHRLHEGLCATLRNGTKIVDQLILRHANTRILDGDGRVRFVWHDLDEEIRLRLNLVWVRDGLVPDLVQGIRSIGNQLSQEDLLVGVKGVDDQAHELLNVSIEGESLRHCYPHVL